MNRNGEESPLILSVDDNEGARYAKTRTLKHAGYRVIEVASGYAAIDAAFEQRPDLILLDTKLPDLDGFEVCARIRANPITSKTLILQTSASFVGISDKIRALNGGADNYLVEPVESDELIANIRALLRLRRAEKDLSESQMRFQQIAENIDDVFWMYEPNSATPLYVSPAYEQLWERPSSKLLEDGLDWLLAVHKDDKELVSQAYAMFMAGDSYELEYRIQIRNGIWWVHDRGYVLQDAASNSHRLVRITQDINDRKRYEQSLQEADRRKDEFLATLAHELRNPLGPILNAVQMMKLAPSPERTEKGLAMVERQTRQLVNLVDDLLDIARITNGKISIKPQSVKLRDFINSAIEASQPLIEKRNHQLIVELPVDEVWMEGDPTRLAQIVLNLLNNAAKYTLRGGHIQLTATANSDEVTISVTDNGIGIPVEQRQRIFELFAQANHAPDRAQDGLGIGLSLVKTLVDMHGGSIYVMDADEGAGSRFDLVLPVSGTPHIEEENLAISSKTSVLPRKLLVVDDNFDAAEMLVQLLSNAGYEAQYAVDGVQAIELAQAFIPDVVLCDIGLPGMDGHEVARRMSLIPALQNTRLIALTGYGTSTSKFKSREAGFEAHLVKPSSLDEIQSLLRTTKSH